MRLAEELAGEIVGNYEATISSAIDNLNYHKQASEPQTPLEAKAFLKNGHDYKQFIVDLIEKRKDDLMQQAIERGIKLEHLQMFLEQESLMDFDLETLITRMINVGLISAENGYENLKQIKHPDGIQAVKKRRTEAELDQMKGV